MAETLNGSHTSSSPQLQIALALAIVKQKPSDVELRGLRTIPQQLGTSTVYLE